MWFLTLVLKNLLRRKVRSLLTAVGMGVAVCAVVTMVGVSQVFETSVTRLFEQRGVDVIVSRAGVAQHLLSSLDETMGQKYLAPLPGVQAVDRMLVDVVPFEKPYLPAVYVLGCPAESPMFQDLRLTAGRIVHTADRRPVLLGSMLANSLQKQVGDKVRIEGADWKVVGIYESYNLFENGAAIVPLADLQERMGKEGKATTFLLKVAEGPNKNERIDALCRQIEELTNNKGDPLGVIAKPTQDHIRSNLELQVVEVISWATSAIALSIGVIGMLNTMMMSVFERTREIGTLRAVGWRRRRIVRMIFLETLALCGLGVAIGLLLSVALTNVLSHLQASSTLIPRAVPATIMIQGSLLAVGAALLGCIYPAFAAANLLPMDALRRE